MTEVVHSRAMTLDGTRPAPSLDGRQFMAPLLWSESETGK